jgi:hypothetical protein
MMDLVSTICKHDNCKTQAIFGLETDRNKIYCAKHKTTDTIDLVSARCKYDNCNKLASYGLDFDKKRIYCANHKTTDTIDLVSARCKHNNCNKYAKYGLESDKKRSYCFIHKTTGMINVVNPKCKYDNCNKYASYGLESDKKLLHCLKHKTTDMINLSNTRCLNNCQVSGNKKYKGYCLFCFINLFPDELVCRNYKTKEKYIADYIKEQFKEYNWICDKSIQGGCSKRRPDMFLELDEQIIIVEIDENQHNDYDCSCENKRLMELSQDVEHKPIVFIRFNPDDYLDNDKNITSCWGPGKDGILRIKKNKVNEWKERLNTLKQQIDYWIKPENTTNKTVEIIQLFYDK